MTTAIVWFRQDLRLADHPALHTARQQADHIIPLYILEHDPSNPWSLGGAQRWWLHHSLHQLDQSLQSIGSRLILRRGRCADVLRQVIQQTQATQVVWNRCYEPYAIARDQQLKRQLQEMGMEVANFNGSLLQEPWTVLNQKQQPFKTYTPFWRASMRHLLPVSPVLPAPDVIHTPSVVSDRLMDWELLPTQPNWASEFSDVWQIGEAAAWQRLEDFIQQRLNHYAKQRDFPAVNATSGLSPHLHWGEISPRQIYHVVTEQEHRQEVANVEKFIAELGWREFSYYLLYHFPTLSEQNFRSAFDQFPWCDDTVMLQAWQRGETGYPIVDAGMRQLWRTGVMHNRVRMVSASLLTKDLLMDWRHGARWFWDTLVDADLANNSASWQWVAGCGADAAPYFRIFNPVLQGEKFDPHGDYVRQWLPELADLPDQWIHQPWQTKHSLSYPPPIVDHHQARQRALDAYRHIQSQSS